MTDPSAKSYRWDEEPRFKTRYRGKQLESSLAEKCLRAVLVKSKLKWNPQHVLAAEKVKGILGCIGRAEGEDPFSLLTLGPVWAHQC